VRRRKNVFKFAAGMRKGVHVQRGERGGVFRFFFESKAERRGKGFRDNECGRAVGGRGEFLYERSRIHLQKIRIKKKSQRLGNGAR